MKDNRGGKRQNAGRNPDRITKDRITVNVPLKYKEEIRVKFKKIVKAYENRCEKEL